METGVFSIDQFRLASGNTLPRADLRYVTRGQLNADKSNAVLLLHGYTSGPEFIGATTSRAAEGAWSGLIGPGKAIDTDRYFVLAPNHLGSCFGSTGPDSPNPQTGTRYGPNFPDIQFVDIVEQQYRCVRSLGISRLHAIAGVSMGGFATLQWGVQYPGFARGLVVALSALSRSETRGRDQPSPLAAMVQHPSWRGGWGADEPAIRQLLADVRIHTLQRYGLHAWLRDTLGDEEQARTRLAAIAADWARQFDPNALFVLARAMHAFDVRPRLGDIRSRVLYVLSNSDELFPPDAANATMALFEQHGVDAAYHEIDSPYGHLASGLEWRKWATPLGRFLDTLDGPEDR